VTPLTAMLLCAAGGAVAVGCLPERGSERSVRWVALGAAVSALLCSLAIFLGYDRSPSAPALQFVTRIDWIASPRIQYLTGTDGIGVVLLLMTGIVAVACVLFSWNVTHRPRAFFGWMLAVIAGATGVFQSLDLVLLFVFYEAVILPKYLLIAIWGSKDREYGAMKLTMYSVAGGGLVLLGILLIAARPEAASFSIAELAGAGFPSAFQHALFPILCLGFGVLAGLWPFHTWAPTGHAAAPTAASMLLAGLVMKLGAYGILRVAMPLCPEALPHWRGVLAGLAVAGILAAALVALARQDLKLVIGYSSVGHMGFVLLGLATLDRLGITGAVLQMFSHAIIAGLLFAVAGRMLYDRTHTRELAKLGGLDLRRSMPFAAVIFVAASAASMGMPGFSGFVAELSVLLGVWRTSPWLLVPAGIGVVLTAAFTMRALQTVLGPAGTEAPRDPALPLDPISGPEILGAGLLLGVSIWIGLFPGEFMDLIGRSLDQPMMHGILHPVGGAR